jgi:hypothetical protein
MGYELQVALPEGAKRPLSVDVESTRKGLRLFAPELR